MLPRLPRLPLLPRLSRLPHFLRLSSKGGCSGFGIFEIAAFFQLLQLFFKILAFSGFEPQSLPSPQLLQLLFFPGFFSPKSFSFFF